MPLVLKLGFDSVTAIGLILVGSAAGNWLSGNTNYFWPTAGLMHACIGKAGVSYTQWIKFYTPILLIYMAMSGVFLLIAQAIQYGPF